MEHQIVQYHAVFETKPNNIYTLIIMKYFAQTKQNFSFQIDSWIKAISLQKAKASSISH